jgi:hypothetical protein
MSLSDIWANTVESSHPKDAKPKVIGSILRRDANLLGVLRQKGVKQGLYTVFWAVTSECFRQLRSQSVFWFASRIYFVLKAKLLPLYPDGECWVSVYHLCSWPEMLLILCITSQHSGTCN